MIKPRRTSSALLGTYFERYYWEVLKHPPYSPDFGLPDYGLFPKLKEPLRGVRYDDLNELYASVNAVIRDINKGCLGTGVRDLPKGWESIIASVGTIKRYCGWNTCIFYVITWMSLVSFLLIENLSNIEPFEILFKRPQEEPVLKVYIEGGMCVSFYSESDEENESGPYGKD
jgi:hypothetical protein